MQKLKLRLKTVSKYFASLKERAEQAWQQHRKPDAKVYPAWPAQQLAANWFEVWWRPDSWSTWRPVTKQASSLLDQLDHEAIHPFLLSQTEAANLAAMIKTLGPDYCQYRLFANGYFDAKQLLSAKQIAEKTRLFMLTD